MMRRTIAAAVALSPGLNQNGPNGAILSYGFWRSEFGADPHVLTGYREKPSFSFQVSMGVYILDPSAWSCSRVRPAPANPRPSRIHFSTGCSRMYPCPPSICTARSVTIIAMSAAPVYAR